MSPQSGQDMNHNLTKKNEVSAGQVTTPDNQEDGAGIQDFGQLCFPRHSRAKFTTTAAGKSSGRLLACASDNLVPTILFR
jgi:hypothetical protein